MTISTATAPPAPPTTGAVAARASDRTRAENRLGWKLVAPAVIMMLLVTAWPMIRAIWLSLFRYRMTAPDAREFVGVQNYLNVLTDPLWWRAVANTVFIMVVTVLVELVIGFAFAMVMHRIIFARGHHPDVDPHPVRHHHGRLGVRLAVRLQPQQRLRQWVAAVRPR